MDYDPDGSKVTPLAGVRNAANQTFKRNNLKVAVNGADVGLILNPGAENNNIFINGFTNSVSLDVDLIQGQTIINYSVVHSPVIKMRGPETGFLM
jgi:hypothetical protein